jgi:hypothetical protein
MEIIEETDDWQSSERFHISYFRFLGFRLTNHDGGGQSGYAKSEETKRKIAIAARGRTMSPEAIEKMKASKKAGLTPEVRERIAAAKRGRKHTEGQRAARSARMVGHSTSEETRRKIAAKATGRKHTPETLAKISAASSARRFTPEQRRRLCEAQIKRRAMEKI